MDGRIGKTGDWRAYFMKQGERHPLGIPDGTARQRLLFLAGKSSLAQLSERHLAAHGLAIGLA